jgi:acetyl-CoA carboxylase carboxyltransferase component
MNVKTFQERRNKILDKQRQIAVEKRHNKGYRTARENLNT